MYFDDCFSAAWRNPSAFLQSLLIKKRALWAAPNSLVSAEGASWRFGTAVLKLLRSTRLRLPCRSSLRQSDHSLDALEHSSSFRISSSMNPYMPSQRSPVPSDGGGAKKPPYGNLINVMQPAEHRFRKDHSALFSRCRRGCQLVSRASMVGGRVGRSAPTSEAGDIDGDERPKTSQLGRSSPWVQHPTGAHAAAGP
jgi:hypothetical protein